MQFEQATFAEYAVRADPSAKLTPYNPADAIFTAARMLCADGASDRAHAAGDLRLQPRLLVRQGRPGHRGTIPGAGAAPACVRPSSPAPGPAGPACAQVTGIRTGMVGNMALAQRTVLILAADDFEDMELLYPLYRLAEEDVEVTVAGLDDHPVHGKKGHGPVPVDTTVEQVAEGDFDALVIPGGFAPDKLRRSQAVLDLVRAFDGAGKPIAFICHAGWVPISARILVGRRATSVGAIRDDMVNAGADWVDEATVVDGNLISARTPADLGPWMKALLKAIELKALAVG